MTTASIATSLVACFIQLICLMSRPLRTMLRVTKHFKKSVCCCSGWTASNTEKKTTSVRISCWCENFAVNPEKCENSKKMFAFQIGVEIPTPRASLVYIYILLTSITSVLPYVPGSSYIVTLFMVHTGSPGILTKMDQSMAWKFIPNGVMTIPDTGRQSN